MEKQIDDIGIGIHKYLINKIFNEHVYFIEIEKYNILTCPKCNGNGYIYKTIDDIKWETECPLCHNRQLGYNDHYKKGNRLVKTGYSTYKINKGTIKGIDLKCETNDVNPTIKFLILPFDSNKSVWISSDKCSECREDIEELLTINNTIEFKNATNRLEGLN